jgi:hypothetical protein
LPKRQEGRRWCGAEFAGCGAGGGRDVGEPAEKGVQGGLAVVDGGAFFVGERNGGEHVLEVVPGFEQLGFA